MEVLTVTVLPSLAVAASETASCLLAFSGRPNYREEFCTFAIRLVATLNSCFAH